MHHSRLKGFIIDCKVDDLDGAAAFWSAALGMKAQAENEGEYVGLDAGPRDLDIEVQRVDHASRVHLDLASDDIDAEATRLEKLGAKRIERLPRWWIMQAPSGQRFCIVLRKNVANEPGATRWE